MSAGDRARQFAGLPFDARVRHVVSGKTGRVMANKNGKVEVAWDGGDYPPGARFRNAPYGVVSWHDVRELRQA